MVDKTRRTLCKLIEHWNESRLDMFAVSQPDENLEMHGIMRFFYQDQDGKCITKCIRVSSTSTARQIVNELSQKFRIPNSNADLSNTLTLYECHENSQERILGPEEKPLFVELNWTKDDKEGRFVLRNQYQPDVQIYNLKNKNEQKATSIKRDQPKRFSKNERKKRQQQRAEVGELFQSVSLSKATGYQQQQQSKEEIPYTTFTRTISNPEMVMKRRREQKLENRIRQLVNGGSLKIYGVELFPNRPYVTLLVGHRDTTKEVVQMAIEKYGLDETVSSEGFVLVEVFLTEPESSSRSYNDLCSVEKMRERYLQDDECPLQLLTCLKDFENVVFFLRRRPQAFSQFPMTKSNTLASFTTSSTTNEKQDQRRRHASTGHLMQPMAITETGANTANNSLPCLVPINSFASTANFGAAALAIQPGITDIGSSSSCSIQLRAPTVLPRHCSLHYRFLPGQPKTANVQLLLLDRNALVEINGTSIHSTVELHDSQQLRIGGIYCYRFYMGFQQQQQNLKEQTQENQGTSFEQNYHQSTGSVEDSVGVNNLLHNKQQERVEANNENSSIEIIHKQTATIQTNNPPIITPTSSNFNLDTNSGGYVDFERIPFIPISSSTATTPVKEQSPLTPTTGQMIVLNSTTTAANNCPNPDRLLNFTQQQQYGFVKEMPSPKIHAEIQQNFNMQSAKPIQHELPILLRCLNQYHEDELLRFELFIEQDSGQHGFLQRFGAFRLIPAFVLYAILRHRLRDCSFDVQQQLNQNTFAKFIDICNRTVMANLSNRDLLVFWLANTSELLNMARADKELSHSVGAHLLNELEQLVQNIFNLFVECCRQGIFMGIQQALNFTQLIDPNNAIQSDSLLAALDSSLRSVRWALLNPALTIQMFSQLFHYISATIFNWLVMAPQARPFITYSFGCKLKQLLQHIHLWAQQQGLELSAECHMDRLLQTVNLLITPKTVEQIAVLGATCYSLNSAQIRYLLENYVGDPRTAESTVVGRDVIEHVVALARMQADQNLKQGTQQQQPQVLQPQLAESNCLQLPFLLPHDGYVVEKLRGIPPNMASFINILQQRGLVQAQLQQEGPLPIAEMSWNVFLVGTGTTIPSIQATQIPNINIATSFPFMTPAPMVPPHQRIPSEPIENFKPLRQSNNNSPSVVYAELQRHPNTEQQRCVSTSILHNQNINHYGHGNLHCNNNGNNNNINNSMPLLAKQQWNERLIDEHGQQELLVQKINIKRAANESLGLSIVEVATPGQVNGIYVKAVIPGSPAHVDGRIEAGDQLLSVNGQSLLGVAQDMAAQKIVNAGTMLHLEVAKKAAEKHGINAYFQQQQQGNGHANAISQQPQNQIGNGKANNNTDTQYYGLQKMHSTQDSLLPNHQIGINGNDNKSRSSLRSPVIYGTPTIGQQYNHIQHSQQSSTSSLSTNNSRLPAHYKPAVSRSQVVVMQPGRPAPTAALSSSSSGSSPINSRRSQSTQNERNSNSPQKSVNQNNFAPQTTGISTVYAQPQTASSKPFFTNTNAEAESPTQINSSTTASTASNSTTVERDTVVASQPSFPQKHQNHASGRVSAPLFGVELGHQHSEQSIGDQSLSISLLQDVERELDALDSGDGQMSTTDQQRYRELLERLVKLNSRKAANTNGTNVSSKLPPSLQAAAQHLERQSKSLAALSLDPGKHRSAALAKFASKSATDILLPNQQPKTSSKMPIKSAELLRNHHHAELVQEIAEVVKKKQPPAVPAKPAIREFCQRPSDLLMFNQLAKKRVQFNVQQNDENASIATDRNNNDDDNGHEPALMIGDGIGTLPEGKQYAMEDEEEPRVQIVGSQEVYMNDPRQKRLQELQENQQKLLKPVMDSSALGFREKMRIFAAQLGEKEPLNARAVNQHKNSSAERQIDNRLQ